jgi:hypothetical protein
LTIIETATKKGEMDGFHIPAKKTALRYSHGSKYERFEQTADSSE